MLRKLLLYLLIIVILSGFVGGAYLLGFSQGSSVARSEEIEKRKTLLAQFVDILSQREAYDVEEKPTPTPTFAAPSPKVTIQAPKTQALPNFSGPELWQAVNKKRNEYGVNSLSQRDELCTIASLRLNELLELGKLDGHEGFSNLAETRSDLKWIFEKYSNVAEFLVSGADSPEDAVALWDNTLGHKKLLTGGEYVWGCIYAQYGFGVAITAF